MATRVTPKRTGIFPQSNDKITDCELQELNRCIENLCTQKCYSLASLNIEYCNGAVPKYGFPLSNACCITESSDITHKVVYSFASIFSWGIDILKAYVLDRSMPKDVVMQATLVKLLSFFHEYYSRNNLKKIKSNQGMEEDELKVKLAHHLFDKLSFCNLVEYTLDDCSHEYQFCPCGCQEKITGRYGDTSLGNSKCWHGFLDIMLGEGFGIKVFDSDEEQHMEDLHDTSEILAQTIVTSFLQKKLNPETYQFLFPSIGVSQSQIIFSFYDSEHDILLSSPAFQLFDTTGEVDMVAIVATWLVVNQEDLCSGVTEEMFAAPTRANFFTLAGNHLEIYNNQLKLQIIEGTEPNCKLNPGAVTIVTQGTPKRRNIRT